MKYLLLCGLAALSAAPPAAAASVHAAVGSGLRATALRVDEQGLESVQKAGYVRGLRHHHQWPVVVNTSESAWSSATPAERERNEKESQWTSTEPDSTDYNEETYVSAWPWSLESTFATLLCLFIASAPVVLAMVADEKLTRTHMLESVALIAWLGGVLYLFTEVLKFQSVHWKGFRTLTIVEAVYLLAQILTTVGYGDITPAFPRGQVWVGINVIIGLMLYGSIVMEVVGIVSARIAKSIETITEERIKAAASAQDSDVGQPLKDWPSMKKVDYKPMAESAGFFVLMATIGIMFFYLKAGENKTLFQATYMSVITLSTVGFGAFTPITEAGKVFGAIWMLVGVSALAALLTSFVDLMMRLKIVQKIDIKEELDSFNNMVDTCTAHHRGEAMDKTDFLKFAMMLKHGMKLEDLEKIETRFKSLGQDIHGNVSLDKIDQAERPPLDSDEITA